VSEEAMTADEVLVGRRFRPGGLAASAALLILGLVGCLALLIATARWGIGVGYDSMFYLTSAKSLLAGLGLQWMGGGGALKPLVHYPPMYPFALASLGATGIDITSAARWISAALFGVNVIMAGWLVPRSTQGTSWGAVFAAALVLASPIMLENHLEAMSEPLFFVFLLLAWGLLAMFLDRPLGWVLVACGLASGAAALTRYVGPAIIAGVVLAILILDRRPRRRRLAAISIYGIAALGPLCLWYVRNFVETGSATNRILNFHPIGKTDLITGIQSVVLWVTPAAASVRVQALIGGLVTTAFVLGVLWAVLPMSAARKVSAPYRRSTRLVVILVTFALCYVVLLFISKLFLDASTRFTNRILSPLYLAVVLSALIIAIDGYIRSKRLWARGAILTFSILLLGGYATRSVQLIRVTEADGLDFGDREWRASEAIAWLRSVPSDTIVYSNEATPIQFLTGLPAYNIPERIDSVQGRMRADYFSSLEEMRSRLQGPGAILVIFPRSYFMRPEYPPIGDLTLGLAVAKSTTDAVACVSPQARPSMPDAVSGDCGEAIAGR
jgi:4-amino-4-deoxy-L-arabinose transferase-like glycosyltransferase